MYLRLFSFLTAILLLASATAYSAPSFDCKKASTRIEKAICNYPVLSELDKELASGYKRFLEGQTDDNKLKAKVIQRAWLKERNQHCAKGDISEVRWCLQEMYEDWHHWNKKQMLSVLVDISGGDEYSILFNPGVELKYSKENIPLDDYPDAEKFSETVTVSFQNTSKTLFKGESTIYSGNDAYTDSVSSIRYFMTKEGDVFTALIREQGSHGGRCDHYDESSLVFIGGYRFQKKFGEFVYYAEDSACGTSYSIVDNVFSDKDNLTFVRPVSNAFYYQAKFIENRAYTVNLKTETIEKSEYFSTSVKDYFGITYNELFERIKKQVLNSTSSVTITDNKCAVPDYALRYYWELIIALSDEDVPVSFNQVKFISDNVLRSEHLKDAKVFKPVIEGALVYLDQARLLPDWKNKLTAAAAEYPEIQATSNFYFSNDNTDTWTTNPFIEAGFPSNECFVDKESPFGYADMEEWIYLFWARRVFDGNIESAEHILRKVSSLM